MKNRFVFLAALNGFFLVAFGAIAAHLLADRIGFHGAAWFDKAFKYQAFHALALLALGLFQIANKVQNPPPCRALAFNIIGGAWSVGILCFSGSLYAMALGASTKLAFFTPIGGCAFLVGWSALIWISCQTRKLKN